MGERKVLNKFIPWDFDPDKLAKVKLSNIGQFSVRMMLPFTVRCNSCGNFMYTGKKFNARKENANGEDYLGLPIVRFYFKCTECGAEFAIKTNPKESNYVVESGASKNCDVFKNERQLELEEKKQQEETEGLDAMKALENRTEESRREMDIYDALDTIHAQSRKTMNADPEEAFRIIQERKEKKEREEKRKTLEEESQRDELEIHTALQESADKKQKEKEEVFDGLFSSKPKTEQKTKALPNGMKIKVHKKKASSSAPSSKGIVSYWYVC